jgi:predicted TIM-barrel fold metal-dependent hydrolase
VIDGIPLVDAHVHAANLPGLKPSWELWTGSFPTGESTRALYDRDGSIVPQRFDDYLEQEGVDLALLFAEYSPKVTGMQTVEDILPLVEQNAGRIRLVANVNPHLHHPVAAELERQLGLGAVALKVHPVHGGFPVNDRALYKAYALCEERGIPVIVHFGTSVFPGAANRYVDERQLNDVVDDFAELTVVLAHGGRGWAYEAAAVLALGRPRVWIEISGLPPQKLPEYYARFDFMRLAERFIFGTDWPGAPGIRANAEAVAGLGLSRELLEKVLYRNALAVYRLELGAVPAT